ncbi:MAG: ATP-binding cassette domain-containing protein [Caulobacteraceae bacterium]|nr:ATP-binding cassette domain-containing protein [Caulobacteraceae bacterium]
MPANPQAPSARSAPPAPSAPVVRLDGVCLRQDGDRPILGGASFTLSAGSFHVLTGAAGCGKSAVLGLIALEGAPSMGRIEVFGRDTAALTREERPSLRRRVGVVFQDDRLVDHLSVFDNAALAPRVQGRKPAAYGDEVAEILAWVGLGASLDAMPGALSPGDRRRLAVARAVAGRPDLLLADEPTAGVDAASGRRILRLLAELNGAGATVLMATRDQGLAASSGAPVLHLRDGKVTAIEAFERAAS